MTTTRILGLFILLLLIFIGSCAKQGGLNPSSPNPPVGNNDILDGYITDSNDEPLPELIVEIFDMDNNPLGQTTTDNNGYFKFDLDPNDDYKISTRDASSVASLGFWEYTGPTDDNIIPISPEKSGTVEGSIGIKIWIPSGGTVYTIPPLDQSIINPSTGVNLSYSIRAASSMQKILYSTDLDSLATSMRIEGARGEHEAFQLVPYLNQSANSIHGVEVTASDLLKGSDRITANNITIFLEHYVEVTVPTDEGGGIGFWPDALVPLTTPFDVLTTSPSPVWIDVNIPQSAVPGEYHGSIRFSSPDGGNYTFHYNLEVWNIVFPSRFYIKANIGLDQEDIVGAHNLPYGLGTPAGREFTRTYAGFLADRHISTHGVPLFQPNVTLNPDNRSYEINYGEMQLDIEMFLDGYDQNNFQFPLDRFDVINEGFILSGEEQWTPDFNARFVDFTEQVSSYLSAHGYLDRSYMWMIDEPNNKYDYDQVRNWSNLNDYASIHPDYMVTEQPAPQDPSFGTLHDHVDIFTMCIRVLDYGESLVRAGAEDKEEWIYTNTNVYPYPSIAIDRQGVELRLFLWFVYQHGFEGMLYSSANDWTIANPWENPMTYNPAFGNGCSSLLYPGNMCYTYTGQDNVNGPVSSIRLEMIRNGLEDTQLLYTLAHGLPVNKADELMASWTDYTDDPDELLRVRGEIADMITSGS